MSKDANEWMGLDEAVEHIMRVTGKSRRQARAALIEKARQGEVKARGVLEGTDEQVAIPPEAWPAVN